VTWAKVDDRLHSHIKAARAGADAMGLWVLALSWCAAYMTDGEVPAEQPCRLVGRRGDALAAKLVASKLWVKSEFGYRFHGWDEYQPTRSEIEAQRSDAKARMQRKRGVTSDVRANNTRTNAEQTANKQRTSHDVREKFALPDPTRPDPEDSLRSSVVARAAHDTDSPPRSRGDGPTCGTDPLQSVAAAPAPAQWALRPSAQQEPPPKAEAPAKGRQRRPAQLVVDPVPPEGTAARRVYEAITTDDALAPIVRGPGDLSMRLVAICDGTSADPVAEVIAAGAWHARNLKWSDGASGLLRWVKTAADRARAMPAVVGTPRAASESARIDYQGKRVVGAAGLPSGDVWASDRDEESEAFARIRERTQPKGRGE